MIKMHVTFYPGQTSLLNGPIDNQVIENNNNRPHFIQIAISDVLQCLEMYSKNLKIYVLGS